MVEHTIVDDGVTRVAGCIEHSKAGMTLHRFIGQLASRHVRHDDIGEHTVDARRAVEDVERLLAVGRFVDDVTEISQACRSYLAQTRLVFDHQYGFADAVATYRIGGHSWTSGFFLLTEIA